MSDVIDGTVAEESSEPLAEEVPAPVQALAIIEPRAGAIISADDPREILDKAHTIAKPLAELIEQAGLAQALNRQRPDRKHVEVGGWQSAGAMLGALGGQPLHAETVWARPFTAPDGTCPRTSRGFDWEACVEIKTPSGVVVGRAEGMVSRSESKWSQRDDYAVRSMAETRAESRAWRKACGWIVHLAGYHTTPAEEMPGGDGPAAAPLPGWANNMQTPTTIDRTREVVSDLLDGADAPEVDRVMDAVRASCDGVFPIAAAIALAHTRKARQNLQGAQATDPPPAPAETPQEAAGEPTEAPAPAGARTWALMVQRGYQLKSLKKFLDLAEVPGADKLRSFNDVQEIVSGLNDEALQKLRSLMADNPTGVQG